jgi:hypothetical protein
MLSPSASNSIMFQNKLYRAQFGKRATNIIFETVCSNSIFSKVTGMMKVSRPIRVVYRPTQVTGNFNRSKL